MRYTIWMIFLSLVVQTEHLTNLDEVLKRLREAGFRLCKKKCVFWAESVIWDMW